MSRCGCAEDRCGCTVVAGNNVAVYGSGSRSNPYVVEAIVPSGGGGSGEPGPAVERITGEIIAYGGSVAPEGWLLCDGSEINRSAYSALYAVLGTVYGAGDGLTTFNLPDLQDKFPMGAGTTGDRGESGGLPSIKLTTAQMPQHAHTINHDHPTATTSSPGTHAHTIQTKEGSTPGAGPPMAGSVTGPAGAVQSEQSGNHNHTLDIPNFTGTSSNAGQPSGTITPVPTVPPYVAVNYIVKT